MTKPLTKEQEHFRQRLEAATGWNITAVNTEDGPAFYLNDPYGDTDGDPWHEFQDLQLFTEPEVIEHELANA